MNQITKLESVRLAQLEIVIKRGQDTFVEVAEALIEIRDGRLYRSNYDTFEAYCKSEWGWSAAYGHKLIQSGNVVKSLPPVQQKTIRSEAVARELAKVPQRRRVEVLIKAEDETGGKVTAKAVKEVFASLPQRKKAPAKVSGPKDGTGLEIPPERLEFWNRNEEAQGILSTISRLKGILERAREEGDLLFAEIDFVSDIGKLTSLYQNLKCMKSYAVCPDCNGILINGCSVCRGRGFVSQFYWDNCIPKEKRELRE